MDRAGDLTWKLTGQTGPAVETGATRRRIPPSGDPWAN
jgi:hypothetical protein